MNDHLLPIEYHLEIYNGDCIFSASSLKPFPAISAGEHIDPSNWAAPPIDNSKFYVVTRVIHSISDAVENRILSTTSIHVESCNRPV